MFVNTLYQKHPATCICILCDTVPGEKGTKEYSPRQGTDHRPKWLYHWSPACEPVHSIGLVTRIRVKGYLQEQRWQRYHQSLSQHRWQMVKPGHLNFTEQPVDDLMGKKVFFPGSLVVLWSELVPGRLACLKVSISSPCCFSTFFPPRVYGIWLVLGTFWSHCVVYFQSLPEEWNVFHLLEQSLSPSCKHPVSERASICISLLTSCLNLRKEPR